MLALISLPAYLIAAILVAAGLYRQLPALTHAGILLGWVGALFHGLMIAAQISAIGGLDANLFSTLSLVMLLIVVVLLVSMVRFPVTEICIVAFPGAALAILVTLLMAPEPRALQMASPMLEIHVYSSLLAYSLLTIAAINAILIAVQDGVLRRHRGARLLNVLPPLTVMERLLLQLVWSGWIILTVGLLSGLAFLDDLFAQHLAHKTILSILAWLVFGLLLAGRWRFGWRGMRVVRLTLVGMAILILAYFGSKAVLELILDRSWQSDPASGL